VNSLFAALNVATGETIGNCHRKYRHQEFLKFLTLIEAKLLPDAEVHIGHGQLRHARGGQITALVRASSALASALQ
jgi:hypothetical protein